MVKRFKTIVDHYREPVSIAPLVVLRVLFGGVMLAGTLRFVLNGWVETQYVQPQFFFKYFGFEWVTNPGAAGMYILFALMGLSALMIMLGSFYRLAAITFFLSFTYVELIDLTNYLNHYYFISLLSLLMIFVPAHRSFSIDVWRKPALKRTHVPRALVFMFQAQLGMVYFFAGLAKLNYEWLVQANPMSIWLPAKTNMLLIGPLLAKKWVAYAFSWAGAAYDLSIPFLLANKRTRLPAYIAVIAFHLMTAALFQIGMFPYIMILLTLIFFPPAFHHKLLQTVKAGWGKASSAVPSTQVWRLKPTTARMVMPVIALFFIVQLVFPFRHLLYPGNLFWTEEGYRFSWRVMLMEKAGTCFFYITDPETGNTTQAEPDDYLTPFQEKMMATQPDMILQFAHFLEKEYRQKGINDPEIRVKSYVRLNQHGSRLFIDPQVDLTQVTDGWEHKWWVLPFDRAQTLKTAYRKQ